MYFPLRNVSGQMLASRDAGIHYHQIHLGGGSAEEMVEEVRSTYDGEVFYGRDLDVF